MKIHWFAALVFLCAACSPTAETPIQPAQFPAGTPNILSKQGYRIRQHLSLSNTGDHKPAKQNLWVALIYDLPPYQEVVSRSISPGSYVISSDEYGNQYAEFDLSDHPPGTRIDIEIAYQIFVNEIAYDLTPCTGELPDEFTQPELHIESSNPQIVSLAKALSGGTRTACQQVRSFYDYLGDELVYGYNQRNWGAQATFGLMGADCTEYASLMMALSRSAGIPARYYEGLVYLEASDRKGEEELAQTEHSWLDVYLPGHGWVAMDPTMGRWEVHREEYFAHHVPNHIIVTTGRSPSTLRGANYWSHLYWPGNITTIRVTESVWEITPLDSQ